MIGTDGVCISEHCGAWIGESNKSGFLAWEPSRKVALRLEEG